MSTTPTLQQILEDTLKKAITKARSEKPENTAQQPSDLQNKLIKYASIKSGDLIANANAIDFAVRGLIPQFPDFVKEPDLRFVIGCLSLTNAVLQSTQLLLNSCGELSEKETQLLKEKMKKAIIDLLPHIA